MVKKQKQLETLHKKEKTTKVLADIEKAKGELDKLLAREETRWAQYSRATWLEHGHKNTKFSIIRHHKDRSTIGLMS